MMVHLSLSVNGLFFVHVTAKSMYKLVLNHQSEYGIKCLLLE